MNRIQNHKTEFQDLENMEYNEAWTYQEKLLASIIDLKMENKRLPEEQQKVTPNYFLYVSHPHVYTLGKSGHLENLLIDDEKRKELGVAFAKTNRGGDITYHGAGQIVGYPILDLENFFTDIHKYMRNLEEVIIRTIADYGLRGERSAGETGVWLDVGTPFARKICAMGVKSSRWVTMHGFALNVNTDLKYFDYIIPCGIRGKAAASMQRELGYELDIEKVKQKLKNHFAEVFNIEWL